MIMKATMIYPELGEKTNATIEYSCSYNGGFYLTTDCCFRSQRYKNLKAIHNPKEGVSVLIKVVLEVKDTKI